MSSPSVQVYNGPVYYHSDQPFNAGYPSTGSYESLGDTHTFSSRWAHYNPSLASGDQYSDGHSTPDSRIMNLEGNVVVQEPYLLHASHASHTGIPQTVQPTDTTSYTDPLYYHQSSQVPTPHHTPPPPTPSACTWTGPDYLKGSFIELSRCMQLMPREPLPKEVLLHFLEAIRLPSSTKGKGSRHGAEAHVCLWPGCGKRLPRRDHGTNHVAGHFGSKPFFCDKCGRGFLRIADKRRHIRLSCNKRETSVINSPADASSGNSSGSSTSGSDSGTEPSQYAGHIEVWRSIMGSWLSRLRWTARGTG